MKLMVATKLLIVNKGKVLLIREAFYDEGSNEGKWDVPGGRINPEEPLMTGLKRDVREECGLEVEVGKVLGVSESFQTIKGEPCHIIRIYYKALASSSEVVLSSDHDLYEWIDPVQPDDREYVSEDILKMLDKLGL